MSGQAESANEELQNLIRLRIENLRPKLLDLSRRNPLISTRFSPRSSSHIRVVDELPDVLSFYLSNEQRMRFVPLPPLERNPKDEETRDFQDSLANARLTDVPYLTAIDKIAPSNDNALDQERQLERELRDRIRHTLGLSPRQTSNDVSLPQHAKNNGISPAYELPEPTEEHEDGRHTDADIQTLLLPDDLERKMNGLISKCRSWAQETGLNVLHAAFGFLEWSEPNSKESSIAPLILVAVEIEKIKTREGPEFWVKGSGDKAETNLVLAEKLRLEFGIDLPQFESGSVEEYLREVSDLAPTSVQWKVRRHAAFGVFPSARMAMYHDLDTSHGHFEQKDVLTKLFGGSGVTASTPFADEYEVDLPEIECKVPFLVMDADSSQFSSIVDIAEGRNLAVEGPPGTGKSQTIVNTIANALAEGKKVLFVAEKLAALNVVKSRLEAIGLGEFILPLQADRSTRENVIESIRNRVDMTVDRISPEYEVKIAKFKKTRSELSTYIDVISTPFGQTGFTVYDIIGKNVATNRVLLGKPKALLTPQIKNIESYDKSRIDELKSLGNAMESAWLGVQAVQPYWAGLDLISINKFMIEEICELAHTASMAYRAASDARSKLGVFNVDTRSGTTILDALSSVLDVLGQSSSVLDIQLINRLCRDGQLQTVISFLDGCKRLHAIQNELSQIFSDVTDKQWCERLRSIQILCKEQEINTLNFELLASWRREADGHLNALRAAQENLVPFVDSVSEGNDWPIDILQKAREFAFQTPREVLAIRNETTADPIAASVVKWAGSEGKKLLQKRNELEKVISVTQEVSISDLTRHMITILNAGVFSIFSSDFRAAKRAYNSLSRRPSFDKVIAAEDLRSLVEWKEVEKRFLSDHQVLTVFGLHFRGVETDFDLFDRLMRYYEAIDHNLTGPLNRSTRKFLKTGDLDLVLSIPEIGINIGQVTFSELSAEVVRLEARLTSFDAALDQLTKLVSGLKKPAEISVDSLAELANLMQVQVQQKNTLDSNERAKSILGDRFSGGATAYAAFIGDLAAAEAILSLQTHAALVLGILNAGAVDDARSAVDLVIAKDSDARVALQRLCERTGIDTAHFVSDRIHSEIADTLLAASRDTTGIQVHSKLAAARNDIAELGFDWIVESLLAGKHPLDDLGVIAEAVVVRALTKEVYQQHGSVLSRYSGGDLNNRRSLLAKLDREIIEMSRKHLRAMVFRAADPPHGRSVGRKSTWTDMALIENEINKKQRFIPVRELTKRAGDALLELKPCWMMSPLAVAQYVPKGTLNFDLSIIDEASQMPPEDSVGALARSRQAMVVGDTNQLPPTNFFRKMIDDEDADEDEVVLNESILEMANAAFRPARRLRWHYRSRHSALIRFSNHLVYDDDLIVFPSATETRADMGVLLKTVDGCYHAGTNSAEATAMIDATLHFMRTNPDRSLGIVTLNQKQRDLLLEEMQYALNRDGSAAKYVERWSERKDGLESFFIKNLENVQGDERDVIFIGTVYGPEKLGGPVMQRFGPINGLAGRRRLNVLFTRAKQQMVTFSSMTAADIKADENSNPGTYMLKRWLEYSATGVLQTGEQTRREPDSDFEIFVAEQIRAMGCEAVPQVGVAGYFIDIGVKHPQWPHGFIMAVECDGATYHSSKSARDRDRLRQEVLEQLGWFFHRIWSVDWFNNPQREAEKLREGIENRLNNLKNASPDQNSAMFTTESEAPRLVGDTPSVDFGQSDTDHGAMNSERPATSGATGVGIAANQQLSAEDPTLISVGDKVRIRYLSGTQTTIEITISDAINAPDRGYIHVQAPLGEALLGAEEGDEVDVLVGSYLRRAVIEKVTKRKAPPSARGNSYKSGERIK